MPQPAGGVYDEPCSSAAISGSNMLFGRRSDVRSM